MLLEQTLPELKNVKNVKDIIIHVLSEEWPLTSNAIYNKAKRKYALEASYQAVHKMLKHLTGQGIVVKKGREYSISMQWAENLEKFSKNLKTKLVSHKPLYLDGLAEFREETSMQTFVFDSFGEAEEYRKKLQREYIELPGPKPPYIGQSRHLKSPIVYSERSLSILNTIRKTQTECYLLVAGKTKIDNWCASYYQNEFVRVKTDCDVAKNCETMVLGDVITQMYVPNEIQEHINRSYNSAEKISDIVIPKFNKEIYEKKAKTKFVVYKNSEMAEQVRKQATRYFSERVSLFDIDGTLVDGVIPTEFAEHLAENGLFEKRLLGDMVTLLDLYRKGKKAYNSVAMEIIRFYAKGIKGQSEERVREEAQRFYEKPAPKFFPYATDLIGILKQKGKVVAVTGSPIEVVEVMRKTLPFDEIFATTLGKKDGKYTGDVIVNMGLAEEKSKKLKEFFEKENCKCLFSFGDTLSDLTLLEEAKISIALNPNQELEKTALEKGWKILTESDDVTAEVAKLARKFK